MNSVRKFLNFTKKVPPNLLKSLNCYSNTSLFSFQVKQDFSVFYNTSKRNFAKEKKDKRAYRKEQEKQKDRKEIDQLNSLTQEDLVLSYENRAQGIVIRVREDLSKIPSFYEYFKSKNVNLETRGIKLSEIATVSLREQNIIKIEPLNMDHKDSIIKSLKNPLYILDIKLEDKNIIVSLEEIPDDLKKNYNAEIKLIEAYLNEEAEKLRSAATKEIKKLEESIEEESLRKLEKQIIKTINKETIIAEKEIKMKIDEVNNNNNVNIGFFDYDETNFNIDLSFHEIIHSKPDPKEDILIWEFKKQYLYSQNRDIPFQETEDYIKSNSANDTKKVLISLNNNNGVGKSHFLQILRHKKSLNKYFFLPIVDLGEDVYVPDALLLSILQSIHIGFGFDNIAVIRDFNNYNVKLTINSISNLLETIMNKANSKEEVNKACHHLFDGYFILKKDETFDPELILGKVRGKDAIYFCLDEIGRVKRSEGKVLGTKSYRIHFEDKPETHDRLIAMDELRILLNDIISKPGLGVIVAGKNGLESFMGKNTESPNEIKHINLPPLLKKYIEPILKFELYRNSNSFLRKYFKRVYPEKCSEEKKDELNEKMNTLIEKLYVYTAGHPRLFNYTLTMLMRRSQIDIIDDEFMESIKPVDKFKSIFERYNNKILYQYFLKKLNLPKDEYSIKVLENKELLYLFYFFNKGGNSNLKVNTVEEVFYINDLQLTVDDLLNSIGLVKKDSTKEGTFQVIIPKYITNELDKIDIKCFSPDFVKKLIYIKYEIGHEKCNEIVSIFAYAMDNFFKEDKEISLKPQLIDGYSRGNDYLDKVFGQIGNLEPNRIVIFNLSNNFAIDGLMFKYCNSKLIIHFIQVKTGENINKTNIFEQIQVLENGMESIKPSLLKYLATMSKAPPSEDDIKVEYVLISNQEVNDHRTKTKIDFKWIKREKKDVQSKLIALTTETFGRMEAEMSSKKITENVEDSK